MTGIGSTSGDVLPAGLRSHVDSISPLGPAWETLVQLFTRQELAKNEHFAPPGRPAQRIGLLESGYVRAYLPTEDGREYNKHIFVAPGIIGDYASLLTGRPVRVPQQAITDCVVWVASYQEIVALEVRHPELARLARRFAEVSYLMKEQREIELATMDAAQRYRRLLARRPDLESHVPLYHIASYLGITPTQLSRIRSAPARGDGSAGPPGRRPAH